MDPIEASSFIVGFRLFLGIWFIDLHNNTEFPEFRVSAWISVSHKSQTADCFDPI